MSQTANGRICRPAPLTKLNQAGRSTLKAAGNVEIDGAQSQQEEDSLQAVV